MDRPVLIAREHRVSKSAEMPFMVVHVMDSWTRIHLPLKRMCEFTALGLRADGSESQPSDLIVMARDAERMEATPAWRSAIASQATREPAGLWSRFWKTADTGSIKLPATLLLSGPHVLIWPAMPTKPLRFFSGDCGVVGEGLPHVDLISFDAAQVVQLVFAPR